MKRLHWLLLLAPTAALVACNNWNPSKPFERESPEVRQAIGELDAGQPKVAGNTLEEYLATGACRQGAIGTPPRLKERPNASFDLGLAFFKVAESLGKRFGEEDDGADGNKDGQLDPNAKSLRGETVECALAIVRAVGADASQPVDLRARARFVEGNLLFLNGAYEDAIKAYDQALESAPGMHPTGPTGAPDSGTPYTPDAVGRDVAWNRAIALRRLQDQKDKDAGQDASPDSGGDDGGSQGDSGQPNQNPDGGSDQGDAGQKPQEPPPPRASQEERLLDQLENAPTVQQEAAKNEAKQAKRRIQRMVDK